MYWALQHEADINLLPICCLEERHEVLLKVDSVAEFKNMFQGTYKDTKLLLTLNIVLFAEALPEATTQGINGKTTLL